MNEEQKKYLSSMRNELNETQCNRLISGVVDELEITAKELMDTMSVLDVVQEKNKPRVQLVSVLCSMSKAILDIVNAEVCDAEDKSL